MAKNPSKRAGKKPADQPDGLPDPVEQSDGAPEEDGALSDGDTWYKPFYLRVRLYSIAGVILSAAWLKGAYDYVESMLGCLNNLTATALT
jgi:hypothetical protein